MYGSIVGGMELVNVVPLFLMPSVERSIGINGSGIAAGVSVCRYGVVYLLGRPAKPVLTPILFLEHMNTSC